MQHSAQCVLSTSPSITLELSMTVWLGMDVLCNTSSECGAETPRVPLCGCTSIFECLATQPADATQKGWVVVLLGKVSAPLQERCPFPLFQDFWGHVGGPCWSPRNSQSAGNAEIFWVQVCCTCDLMSLAMMHTLQAASSEGCHSD